MRGMSGMPRSSIFVRETIDADRLEAGVAENDLVVALGRWVAQERRLDVLLQHVANVGQALEKIDRLLLGQRFEIVSLRRRSVAVLVRGAGPA